MKRGPHSPVARTRLFWAGCLALALVVSACGGDDDTDDSPSSTTATAAVQPTPSPTPDPVPGPEEIIIELQTDLAELGYYRGPIDGDYNEATVTAVRDFQEFAGLGADGVYGGQTAAALDVALGRSGGSTALQNALAAMCYYDGEIDGLYGPGTEQAVKDFQEDAGVGVDGLYGPKTADALVAAWPDRPASCQSTSEPATEPTQDAAVDDAPETLDAITVIARDGTSTTFGDDVSCTVGPDDAGSVRGTADDGSTILVTLDGTASTVLIDSPTGPYDAPVTSLSNDQTLLTVQAGPPPVQVLVTLSFCAEG